MSLGRFPVRLTVPVQWGEQDAFHHVNNTVFLRWFESARIAYFSAIGLAIELQGQASLRPILARATIDYRAPVTFPDTITVEATVKAFGNKSFTMGYRATSQAQGRVVAEGDAVIVLLDPSGATTLLPDDFKAKVSALEAAAAS
jgi:acyl-CoA thioester hydrolase